MRLIGICGKMGAGKDEVAKILMDYRFERYSFGSDLRHEISTAMIKGDSAPECLSDEAVEAFKACDFLEVYDKPTTKRMRALLQQWGTEYRRSQNPNYWTDKMFQNISRASSASISDVRFANEADLVRELGGKVWLIKRPGCQESTHVSESIPFDPDYIIHNTGTLDDLASEVKRALTIQGLI